MTQSKDRSLRLLALSPLALALAMASAHAAQRVDLHKSNSNIQQLNAQYAAATANLGAAASLTSRHEELVGLDANSRLSVLGSQTDKDGTRHVRYQQTFRGVPVFGHTIMVSQGKDGAVRNLFGTRMDGLASELASTTAKLTPAQALAAAKGAALGNSALALQTRNESSKHMIYIDDSGHALGTLCVISPQARGLEPRQAELLAHLATQVVKRLQQRRDRLHGAADER